MENLAVPHTGTDISDDVARVRASLLDALALLDRSPLPMAATAATYVSHAVELVSPGTDMFELIEPGERIEPGHAEPSA